MSGGLLLTVSIFCNIILFVLYTFDKTEQYIYSTNKRKQCLQYKEDRDLYFSELQQLQVKYDTLKFTYDELIKGDTTHDKEFYSRMRHPPFDEVGGNTGVLRWSG